MSMTLQSTYSTVPAIGYEGQLEDGYENVVDTFRNDEASASIGFGRAVCFDLSAPASDLSVLLPAVETDTVAGIVVFEQSRARAWTDSDGTVHGELDGTGLRPGTLMAVLRRGRILVKVEDGCAVGDRLWVRAVAGGDPEFLGGINNADDSTDMIDCTKQGVFLTSASAGGLAWLDVDFSRKP